MVSTNTYVNAHVSPVLSIKYEGLHASGLAVFQARIYVFVETYLFLSCRSSP